MSADESVYPEGFDCWMRFGDSAHLAEPPWYGGGTRNVDDAEFQEILDAIDHLPPTEYIRQYRILVWRHLGDHAEAPANQLNKQSGRKRRWFDRKNQVMSAHARALSLGRLSTLTLCQWDSILTAFDWACAYCGCIESMALDHVVPLSLGGANSADNVVPACFACNSSKRDHDVAEWLASRGSEWSNIMTRIDLIREAVCFT